MIKILLWINVTLGLHICKMIRKTELKSRPMNRQVDPSFLAPSISYHISFIWYRYLFN